MPSEKKTTQLKTALEYFTNTNRQKSIAFVLSDMVDTDYSDALRVAGSRHDVIGLKIYDRMDMHLPNIGMLRVEDIETGEQKWVDTGSAVVRYKYEQEFFRLTDYTNNVFKKAGSDLLHIRTDEDYIKVLRRFFVSRNR
jgi:hypothetical protein